MQMTHFHGRNG